jgi:hypothetical protein
MMMLFSKGRNNILERSLMMLSRLRVELAKGSQTRTHLQPDMKIDLSLTSLKQMKNRNNPGYPSVKMFF